MSNQRIKTGKNSVVIGNVTGEVGEGSIVIGATDSNGNVILNQPMAVGRNAKAGPNSIAIGANAEAGVVAEISTTLDLINRVITETGDVELIKNFTAFQQAVKHPEQNKSVLSTMWDGIKSAASLNSVADLVLKVSDWIGL